MERRVERTRRSLRTAFLTMAVMFAVAAAVNAAPLQEDPQIPNAKIRAFTLQHSSPDLLMRDLFQLVDMTNSVRAVADSRTSRLIVRAPEATLKMIEEVIAELDVKGSTTTTGLETAILASKHRPAVTLLESIRLNLSPAGRVVADPARNVLIIRDYPESITEARNVMRELDASPASLELQFLVLGKGGADLSALPDARKVATELEATGLAGYGVICRAAVRTVEGETFQTEGFYQEGNLELQGLVRMIAGGQAAEIELQAQVSIRRQAPQSETGSNAPQVVGRQGFNPVGRAHLGSTLRVPLEHLVVVGLAPAGGDASAPLVLVIRASGE